MQLAKFDISGNLTAAAAHIKFDKGEPAQLAARLCPAIGCPAAGAAQLKFDICRRDIAAQLVGENLTGAGPPGRYLLYVQIRHTPAYTPSRPPLYCHDLTDGRMFIKISQFIYEKNLDKSENLCPGRIARDRQYTQKGSDYSLPLYYFGFIIFIQDIETTTATAFV